MSFDTGGEQPVAVPSSQRHIITALSATKQKNTAGRVHQGLQVENTLLIIAPMCRGLGRRPLSLPLTHVLLFHMDPPDIIPYLEAP